jgi:hypothetical protein
MTQEDKDLLLQDLAIRLPYGVKVHINSCIDEQNQMELFDVNLASKTIGVGNEKWAFRAIPIVDIDDNTKIVKPYLRPMSSMTKEERDEFEDVDQFECGILSGLRYLLKNHFDYHDLIPKGLALVAPDNMYK